MPSTNRQERQFIRLPRDYAAMARALRDRAGKPGLLAAIEAMQRLLNEDLTP